MLWLVDCSRRSGRAEKFSPELQATAPGTAGSLLCAGAAAHGGLPRPPQPPAFSGDTQVCPLCPAGGWRPAPLTPSAAAVPVLESPAGPRRVGNARLEPGREQRGCSGLGRAEGPEGPSRDAPGRLQQVEVLLGTCALPDSSIAFQGCQTAGGSFPFSSSISSQDNTSPHPALGTGNLCPAVTGLEKVFGPLRTIGQGSRLALGSKPGFRLQKWVQERQEDLL